MRVGDGEQRRRDQHEQQVLPHVGGEIDLRQRTSGDKRASATTALRRRTGDAPLRDRPRGGWRQRTGQTDR